MPEIAFQLVRVVFNGATVPGFNDHLGQVEAEPAPSQLLARSVAYGAVTPGERLEEMLAQLGRYTVARVLKPDLRFTVVLVETDPNVRCLMSWPIGSALQEPAEDLGYGNIEVCGIGVHQAVALQSEHICGLHPLLT